MDNSLIDLLLVLWFLVSFLYLCCWAMGNMISDKIMKTSPQRLKISKKEIEEADHMVGNWIISILIGILTGIVIVFYNNWIYCSVNTCQNLLSTPNWYNGWYFPAQMWFAILILVLAGLVLLQKWIRRMNQDNESIDSELIKCPRCLTLIQNDRDTNYCKKCAEPLRKK
jgi:NADH:ubiquinone oxidoreductase subunit 5 (subunit L)/multisubunit Na+/H+ antiporter MnhA subunit